MKRIIEATNHRFLREDGSRMSCTAIFVPFKDIPEDLNLTGYDIVCANVTDKNCSVYVKGFDENLNRIQLDIPKWVCELLFVAHKQSLSASIMLLQKLEYEQGLIKNGEEIPYSNIVA